MAKRKSTIDGECVVIDERSTLADVLGERVISVTDGNGQLIPRERFASVPVPAQVNTNLTEMRKGAVACEAPEITSSGGYP